VGGDCGVLFEDMIASMDVGLPGIASILGGLGRNGRLMLLVGAEVGAMDGANEGAAVGGGGS
jgi:hypothetical protein